MERVGSMAADKRVKSLTERGRFWLGHLQRWRRSGLSQSHYCRQRRLSVAAFGWWKGQLSAGSRPSPSPGTRRAGGAKEGPFIELTAAAGKETAGEGEVFYEIVLSNRRCLRLGSGFDPERVRQLLEVLEGVC
jgi:hypothetical protein